MKTKTLEYYADLMSGWQDMQFPPYFMGKSALGQKPEGYRRVKIIVELPVFGGTADVDQIIETKSFDEPTGFQSNIESGDAAE